MRPCPAETMPATHVDMLGMLHWVQHPSVAVWLIVAMPGRECYTPGWIADANHPASSEAPSAEVFPWCTAY
eukprot:14165266-Alexandrium_andersonii.AAC.1